MVLPLTLLPAPRLARLPPAPGEARAPSFDHGVGDPVEGDIAVGRHHAVVVTEGNYLMLVSRCLAALVHAAPRRLHARRIGF